MNAATRRAVGVSLAVLLLAGAPSSTMAQDVDATSLQWWPIGETAIGDGFHLRIPVTVRNDNPFSVENGVVLAEIDIRQKLVDEGWVSEARGALDVLRSFEFDPDSVRVVEMINFGGSGATAGQLKAYDVSYGPQEALRYEVPSHAYQGFLSSTQPLDYDAKTNPVVTVMWRVLGSLAPNDQRYFVVYFDSLTNRDHEPSNPLPLRGGGILEHAFWSAPSTDLLGLVQPSQSQPGRVTVIGLEPNTQVTVLLADAGGLFSPQPSTPGSPNPFTIGADEIKDVFVSNTFGTPFRLLATRPVLALVASEGFVPSTSGTTAGSEFLFATTYPANLGQDSLFVYNRHPTEAETVVQLTPLDGGASRLIHLSDSTNQFPYSLGTHSGEPVFDGAQCVFPDTPEVVPLASGPHKYSARVISGGPVAIQLQPIQGITPIPSTNDGPYGTEFWSPMSRTSATPQGGDCGRSVQPYAAYATSLEDARLELTSPEALSRLFPPCASTPCSPGEPVGPAPGTTLDSRTFATGELTDRPLRFLLDKPGWLMVAPSSTPSLSTAALRGPLGGTNGARDFAGIGSAGLFAPYASTVIEATVDYALSGTVNVQLELGAGRLTPLPERGGNDKILWYSLSANRPILVLPRGAAPGFLAGIPPLLSTTIHDADFRGYLIELESTTGLNPVTASTVPGTPASYTFLVTNLGRAHGGGDLPDTVEFDVSPHPDDWTVEISRPAIMLGSQETQEVVLDVTPPTGADPGAFLHVTLFARSRNNPLVEDSIDTVTRLKRNFDVGMWFDQVGGPKAVTEDGAIGEVTEYTVVLQNLGTVRDTFSLDASAPDTGWVVDLLNAGVPVDAVQLEPLAIATLTLRVAPPPGAGDGVLLTTVEARSLSSPAILDRVAATTEVRSPSVLTLHADNDTSWTAPGQEALFNLTVGNAGAGTTEVTFGLQADRLPGWGIPKIMLRAGPGVTPVEVTRVSLSAGQEIQLTVATVVGPEALATQRQSIRFAATAAADSVSVEEFLATLVQPKHDLRVTAPITLDYARGGENKTLEFRLENKGNLVETVRVLPRSIPAGWSFHVGAGDVSILRNQTQVVRAYLEAPASAPEGAYPVEILLVSYDGNQTLARLSARIGVFLEDRVGTGDEILAQPGDVASRAFSFENLGNVPVDVTVRASQGEPWQLVLPATIRAPPGANVSVPVGWQVPSDASSGTTSHRATLVATPTAGGASAFERALEAAVAVDRPDLRLVDARLFKGPGGFLVNALVVNDGARDGRNVRVALAADGAEVDNLTIGVVPAAGQRNVTLLLPAMAAERLLLTIDPANLVPDRDRTNNAVELDPLAEEGGRASSPAWLAAVGALFLASVLLRKRRAGERS